MTAGPVPVPSPWVIVLAAGHGRRFREAGGGDKLSHRMPDGQPMVLATLSRVHEGLRQAAANGPPPGGVVLVVREERRAELQALLDARPAAPASRETVLTVPGHLQGMGDSLATGARALPGGTPALVMLADLPFVRPDTLAAVARALASGAELVRPVHGNPPVAGHPVGFAARHVPALARMSGESGAGDFLRTHAALMQRLAVSDPGICRDVDVPGDTAMG